MQACYLFTEREFENLWADEGQVLVALFREFGRVTEPPRGSIGPACPCGPWTNDQHGGRPYR
jgi:hypothetical protein